MVELSAIPELRDENGMYKDVKTFTCHYSKKPYCPARAADYDFPCKTQDCSDRVVRNVGHQTPSHLPWTTGAGQIGKRQWATGAEH